MDEHLPHRSTLSRIWHGWRREILRGALLFSVVIVIGLGGARLFGWFGVGGGREGEWRSPFDMGGAGDRNWEKAFVWSGTLRPGSRVFIRNQNGPVTVEAAEGDSVLVVVERSWHHSDPEIVRVDAVPHAGGMTFCAMWEARDAACGPEGDYHVSDPKPNDVTVRFTVRLPRGVGVDVSTVNGAVDVEGVTAPVVANTVNGEIRAEVLHSPFTAHTVNGDIDIRLDRLPAPATGRIALESVNGSITADVAPGVNAVIDASTDNGEIESTLALVASGQTSSRKLAGQVGHGGPRLTLRTVNGSITLGEREGELPESPPAPPAPPAPPSPPTRPRPKG